MAIYLVNYPRRPAREAVQLTLTREDSATVATFLAPFFRVTGSTVWTVRGDRYIARLTDSGWEADGGTWTGMTFEGPCRLLMGVPCEPTSVSEILDSVSIAHDALSANGLALASYSPETEMWRAVTTERWWHAFRIESIHQHEQISDDSSITREPNARRGFSPS
jgi:hypothetical protein